MDDIFRKAAKSALFSWKQTEEGLDDLVNDIWVWYLESPATQKKLQGSDDFLARRLVYKAALQILTKGALSSDMFDGKNLYSSDSVKDALLGRSKNRYLVDILPKALEALEKQNEGYAEAIRSRYTDGVKPKGSASDKLLHAHKSLTEHVNIITITAGVDAEGNVTEGPGSRHAIFPETRRSQGAGHSDPTGDIAIMLIEHPELRDEYLAEADPKDLLAGQGVHPWKPQPAPSGNPPYGLVSRKAHYRPTADEAKKLNSDPERIVGFIDSIDDALFGGAIKR